MSGKKNGSSFTDEALVAGIRQGGVLREKCIIYLYDQYAGFVFKGVKVYKLDLTDAKDAYADAIMATVFQIQKKHFRQEGKISTYLYQSFANRCKNQIRSARAQEKRFLNEIPNLPDSTRTMLEALIDEEDIYRYKDLFSQLGNKCQQILWDSIFLGYSNDEISKRIGYTSKASVSNMKYKCLERLKKLMKINSRSHKKESL